MARDCRLLEVCIVSTPSTSVNRTVPSLFPSVTWDINCMGLLFKPFKRKVFRGRLLALGLPVLEDTEDEFESVAGLSFPDEFFVSISSVGLKCNEVFSLSRFRTRDEAFTDRNKYLIIHAPATQVVNGKVHHTCLLNKSVAAITKKGPKSNVPVMGIMTSFFVELATRSIVARWDGGNSRVLELSALEKSLCINHSDNTVIIPTTRRINASSAKNAETIGMAMESFPFKRKTGNIERITPMRTRAAATRT